MPQNPGPGSQPPYPGGPSPQPPQKKSDTVASIFNTLHGVVHGVGAEIAGKLSGQPVPAPTSQHGAQSGNANPEAGIGAAGATSNRYGSFAGQKNGNDVKWHVDGCAYMYAVSKALENARESIWILDCK